MIIQAIFHVFEMQIGMNEFDHHILALLISSSEKGLKNSGLKGDLNPYPRVAGAPRSSDSSPGRALQKSA